ncbi:MULTISPECIES: Eco57I restriction-modification methylase domain-containing protein [unclassified Variovorax]|uniref:Eco57I restriction-modification methylase domain-containing protein n=1 Tax=unclassified Variovorax TaxID=663243 RepID=UPI00076D4B81|nr:MULTISPECIES: Eco57I restriction-modification methylase domain-containing protein [unclassified Variovorax]KWT98385.1 putative type III restriction system endonuclease [Variovorax sp. WDL1]PNG49954.1 hypothetical protein CHC06_05535 [Variovorax sp. B2]PNG50826.1 hypothetical protein CHC07_05440 [Variovorax sp. B4]VTV18053.1 hypothetical protein WDL1P1_00878 [Variovorax sp. WDL1]
MHDSLLGQHKPDILDCIANLSNDEVFTPPAVANRMLDLLPAEVWTNPELRFLDPGCKSGVFLREAAKRLMKGLEDAIPDEAARLEHVFKNMLHGIAITELTAQISRRTLYYSKDASSKQSVVSLPTADGNIRYQNISHAFKAGSCVLCGAPEAAGRHLESLESHAYLFIHEDLDPSMKFDVIIGNPPYQLKDGEGGNGSSAKPIYQHFIGSAISMNPRYLSMIIPSRWFTDGKGLESFREKMLGDSRVKTIVDHFSSADCFPGVDIAGGVCYFLWDARHDGLCEVTTKANSGEITATRRLNEFDTFVRDGRALPILEKVRGASDKMLNAVVSSRKPFGLDSAVRPSTHGDLTLLWSGGSGPIEKNRVTTNADIVDKWKAITSKVSYDHAGMPDKNGLRRVLSKVEVLPPGHVCTETYLVAGSFDTKEEAENLTGYMKTKFFRFLVSLLSVTQNITKEKFAFVPQLPMTEPWDDAKLYARYGLTLAEIAYIESLIKEMA